MQRYGERLTSSGGVVGGDEDIVKVDGDERRNAFGHDDEVDAG